MVKTRPEAPRPARRTAKTDVVTRVPANEISHRAHELFQARGSEHGHDVNDWLVAEAELHECDNTAVVSPSAETQRRLG
jgi:hypothetical protein